MKNDWLIASNLEFSISVLSAINMLSMHYKLLLAGKDDPTSSEKIRQAKEKIISVVEKLEKLTNDQTAGATSPILGTDAQLGEFALQFLQQKTNKPDSKFKEISLYELNKMLQKPELETMPLIIEYLKELRMLVDQHASSDFKWLWGSL